MQHPHLIGMFILKLPVKLVALFSYYLQILIWLAYLDTSDDCIKLYKFTNLIKPVSKWCTKVKVNCNPN